MATVDFQKLQVIVKDYLKSNNSVVVSFECIYSDETKDFFESISMEDNRKPDFYVRQAFKKLKKPIKQWVREVVKKPGIIGSVMSIPGDFAIDDEDSVNE